jgi:hypothetical protein
MATEKPSTRLCVRVIDSVIRPSSAIEKPCTRCGELVLVNEAQEIAATAVEVCLVCAIDDPVISPYLKAGLAQSLETWARTGIPGQIVIPEPGDEGYVGEGS